MPPFTTASCTIQDAPSLARNNISAFWQDKTWVIIWPNKTLEYVISQATRRMPRNLLKDIEHLRHVKAVDEATGRVVGYCRWELPSYLPDGGVVGDAWAEGKVSDEGVGEEERREIERAFAEADWSYDHSMDFLDRPIGETKRRLMEGKGYLPVHPDHQRQGIASMLVESGIKEAEKLGLDIFVHAKKAGLNVYLRAGFKVLEQIIQDATKYGGDEEYAAYFLVKEAKKS